MTNEVADLFECSLCDLQFEQQNELEAHVKMNHRTEPENEQNFVCDICNNTFAFQSDANNHFLSMHNTASTFYCTKCDHKTNSEAELAIHWNITQYYQDEYYQVGTTGLSVSKL